MFVGLGNESETFREPEQLNLFLSVPPKSGQGKTLEVTYLGFYEVSRVAGLSVTEWGTLSRVVSFLPSAELPLNYSKVQRNYTDTTCSRQSGVTGENKHRAHAKIQAEYGSGVLSVPCVRLRCVGFDDALYAGLLAARTGNSTTLSRERDRPDSDSPSPKRRRTEKT